MANRVSTRLTALNMATQWGAHIANIVVTFALFAYPVSWVGPEHFGGWTAIYAVVGYLTMLDAGMSVVVQDLVARLSAQGNHARLRSVYSAATTIYGISAVLALLVCFGLSFVYGSVFAKVPAAAAVECAAALRWTGLGMLLLLLNMPTQGALIGLHRYYLQNITEVVSLVVRFAVVPVAFHWWGPSLEYLGLSYFISCAVRYVLCHGCVRWIEPSLRFRPRTITRAAFREVFSFGGHTLLWTISAAVIRESGPLIAVLILGSKESTYFYAGTRLVKAISMFITSAGLVLLPVASALHGTQDLQRLRALLVRGTRLCGLMAFAGAAVLLVYGQPLLLHLLRVDAPVAYSVVLFTTLGLVAEWAMATQQTAMISAHILWPLTLLNLFRMLACVGLGLLLARLAGLAGLAAGMAVPLGIIAVTLIPWLTARMVKTRTWDLVRPLATPALVGIVIGVAAWTLQHLWVPHTLMVLIVQCLAIGCLFALLAAFWGLDPGSRRVFVQGTLARLGIGRVDRQPDALSVVTQEATQEGPGIGR